MRQPVAEGGGGNLGSITANGNGQISGNSSDPDLPASGAASGGAGGTKVGANGAAGDPGFVVIYVS